MHPRSLHLRLLVGLVLAFAVLLLAAGIAVDSEVRRGLRAGFDEDLVAMARAIAFVAEREDGELVLAPDELESRLWMRADPADGAGYAFEMRRPDGTRLGSSTPRLNLVGLVPDAVDATPRLRPLTLADGTRARAVALAFSVRDEPPLAPEAAAADPPPVLTLAVARRTVDLEAAARRVRASLRTAGLVAVPLATLCFAGLIRMSLRSIGPVVEQVGALGGAAHRGELGSRLDGRRLPGEIQPLVTAFNGLLDEIAGRVARERRFLQDAAHELRTPVAEARATLEVLRPRLAGTAHADALAGAHGAVGRLQRVTERLMRLAGLDEGRWPVERTLVDVAALVAAEVESVRERGASARGIALQTAPAEAHADPVLLAMVLSNLLDNAVRHGNRACRVEVRVAEEPDGGVAIEVGNALLAGDAPDPARLDEPFYRSRPHGGGDGAGRHAGLGLAICRSAARLLPADLAFRVGDSRFTARLVLPPRGADPVTAPAAPASW